VANRTTQARVGASCSLAKPAVLPNARELKRHRLRFNYQQSTQITPPLLSSPHPGAAFHLTHSHTARDSRWVYSASVGASNLPEKPRRLASNDCFAQFKLTAPQRRRPITVQDASTRNARALKSKSPRASSATLSRSLLKTTRAGSTSIGTWHVLLLPVTTKRSLVYTFNCGLCG
jgi:hypothetical protein